ncbi:hypothetical protein ACIBVL_40000 [Streptomyces sp. NPDC049687]|uniref:hypothetical protein n=1 Tax=Streptomyces sp. NPDC049687 TaxID=3365596 RepID=UPI00379E9380
MTKNARTGVWSYTVPPSGTFGHQFYADCASATLSACTAKTDPANLAWNTTSSAVVFSQVYVPSDKRFGTPDLPYTAEVHQRLHAHFFFCSKSQSRIPSMV